MPPSVNERQRKRLLALRSGLVHEFHRIGVATLDRILSPSVVGDHQHLERPVVCFKADLECAENRIRSIDAALDRLERDTYRQCERCLGDISEERLEAVPYATYCTACERQGE